MSYCRFAGDSDVYVYADVGGWLSCCSCCLVDNSRQWRHFSTDAMIAHLHEHIAAGHDVPDDVIPDLERDRKENDAWIASAQQTGEPR